MIEKEKRNNIFKELSKKFGNEIAKDIEQSIYIFSQKYADDNGTPFLLENIYDSKADEILNILNDKNLMFIIQAIKKEDISITPIGIPLIAGPGAITSVMLLSSQTNTFIDKCIVHINIIITLLLTYIILLLGKKISKKIGTTGIRIIQRIMGLILLVISIQFIINGILLIIENQLN